MEYLKAGNAMRKLSAALVFMMTVNPLWADSAKPFRYVATFEGACKQAIVLDKDKTDECHGQAVNIARIDGRVEFGFYLSGKTILIFSGGKDSQPEENNYRLEVDTVRMLVGSESQGDLPASGACTVSGDVAKAAKILCQARVDGRELLFNVEADRPAVVEHPE
jgi:hypothetical protein